MKLDEISREGRKVDQYGMTCETIQGRFGELIAQYIGYVFSRIGEVSQDEEAKDAEMLCDLCRAYKDWRSA